jgi:hypothetical protein
MRKGGSRGRWRESTLLALCGLLRLAEPIFYRTDEKRVGFWPAYASRKASPFLETV